MGRPFPWFCPKCHKKEVRPATISYQTQRLHEGRLVAVHIPHLDVPKCSNCGELVFNYAADEQILEAVRRKQPLRSLRRECFGRGTYGFSHQYRAYPANLLITSAAFWPPNPKLVETPVLTGTSRAVFGT